MIEIRGDKKVLITPVVILVGMLSHLGPDSGYVIIIPIAAYMFYAVGKHPLAGIAFCRYCRRVCCQLYAFGY